MQHLYSRVKQSFYLHSTHCSLNLLTLTLSDKRLEDQLRDERANSFNRLFWWVAAAASFFLLVHFTYWFFLKTSPTTLIMTLFQYMFLIVWALMRLSKRKSVHRNLPHLTTVLYVFSLLLLNLIYRNYLAFGNTMMTNSQTCLLYLIMFHSINYNSIMWTVCVQNPMVCLL